MGWLAAMLIAAPLAFALVTPSAAQSADGDAPRAAPTTPVWTAPPPVARDAQNQAPRYAVMAAGNGAEAPSPQIRGDVQAEPAAPAPPVKQWAPPRYSVMQEPPSPAAAAPAGHGAEGGDAYVLGTGDKLRVNVYGEPDLSGDFDVGSSGEVRLPLIGQIQAAGLDVHAFEQKVASRLGQGYLLNPRVSAEVIAYRPFFIIGEVNKPGQYAYVNGMNVVTAVALAGGFTYRADESDVYVRRNGSAQEVERPADETTNIHPGDIIRVTERFF